MALLEPELDQRIDIWDSYASPQSKHVRISNSCYGNMNNEFLDGVSSFSSVEEEDEEA